MKSTSLLLLALLAGGCQPERTPEVKEAPPSFESARFQLVVVDQAGGDAHGLWKLDNRSGQTWRFVASGWVEVKDAPAVASPAISDSETLRPLTGEETEPANSPPAPQVIEATPTPEVRPATEAKTGAPVAPGVKLASPKEMQELPKR